MTKEEAKIEKVLVKMAKLIKNSGLNDQDIFAVLFSAVLTEKRNKK